METILTFWAYFGFTALTLINIAMIGRIWLTALEDKRSGSTTLPFVMTVSLLGSFGLIFLGYGPEASRENTALHGEQEISKEALSVQLREAQQAHLQTKQELEVSRKQNLELQHRLDEESFRDSLKQGQNSMQTTRNRLMNREKE